MEKIQRYGVQMHLLFVYITKYVCQQKANGTKWRRKKRKRNGLKKSKQMLLCDIHTFAHTQAHIKTSDFKPMKMCTVM